MPIYNIKWEKTVGTFQNPIKQIVETGKIKIYMTAHFPDIVQAIRYGPQHNQTQQHEPVL